jgi:hypothetical protein
MSSALAARVADTADSAYTADTATVGSLACADVVRSHWKGGPHGHSWKSRLRRRRLVSLPEWPALPAPAAPHVVGLRPFTENSPARPAPAAAATAGDQSLPRLSPNVWTDVSIYQNCRGKDGANVARGRGEWYTTAGRSQCRQEGVTDGPTHVPCTAERRLFGGS